MARRDADAVRWRRQWISPTASWRSLSNSDRSRDRGKDLDGLNRARRAIRDGLLAKGRVLPPHTCKTDAIIGQQQYEATDI